MKSGTSIGANVSEATAAQTKADFITKMAIASKEARETRYWLRLLSESGIIKNDITVYLKESDEIINILTAIVKTAQKNR
jgi:four helix bundle protein